MQQSGDLQVGDAACGAAAALFHTIAHLRPSAATVAARRVVLADALTRDAPMVQRRAALVGCMLSDFGRVVLRLPTGEAAQQSAELLDRLPALADAAIAIAHRHERVDGSGLPLGLVDSEVPLASRVIALVDLVLPHRSTGPIDWDRRLEIMKDNAGTALDPDLAETAYAVLEAPELRRLIEAATPGTAIAVLEGAAPRPESELESLSSLITIMSDPTDAAAMLVDPTRAASGMLTVGVLEVRGELLTEVGIAGPASHAWRPLALTSTLAALAEPTTITAGDGTAVHVVPIRTDALWGLAWGVSGPEEADPEPLRELAAALGTTIERRAERARLDRMAHDDELTGLANRRRLDIELRTLYQPGDDRADAALIMCDVDGLKRVNDTRGHAAGDEVLRSVASVLTSLTDGVDAMAARLGGDEFCVLIRSGALLRAQSLARAMTQQVRTQAPSGVGLSCGIAFAANADSPSELLRQADEAQYVAKRRRAGSRPPALTRSDRRRRPR